MAMEIKWAQSPEYSKQMELFEGIQAPWMKSQFGLYGDIFEPQMRELGGMLGEQAKAGPSQYITQLGNKLTQQLDQPLQLPQDVWQNIWQQGAERVTGQYQPLRQKAGERAAGAGMLGQGPTENYFQNLDLAQAKSMEDMAIDMAIQEWTEKKSAQQQSIQNMQQFIPLEEYSRQQPIQNLMQFQGLQPQFNIPMPSSIPYTQEMEEDFEWDWGSMLTGGLTGAAAGFAMGGPVGAGIGAVVGGAGGGLGGGASSGGNIAPMTPFLKQLAFSGGVSDPTGRYNVGYGQGSYPGGYSGMSGL